ncbi:eukaryotic translation initiation factor 4E-like [Halichondria panicea]|uniref:eukaryotic translation initiation factor 4E-like n=1 Tax=Halichondria panicea TaxID=6063 RepID=UPI00312B584A
MSTSKTEQKEDSAPIMAAEEVVPEKHPLQNKWSLWYLKQDKSKDWKDNLKNVISFDTVEDFWSVFNHIKPPSMIQSGCDYMLFKDGIQPAWEDAQNIKGGRWLLQIDKKDRRDVLDSFWLETIMLLIGEGFDDSSDEVRGAVVQIRGKGDKIAIWTGNSKKTDDVMAIGRTFREKLMTLTRRPPYITYQSHDDVATKSGSVSKNMHTLGGGGHDHR